PAGAAEPRSIARDWIARGEKKPPATIATVQTGFLRLRPNQQTANMPPRVATLKKESLRFVSVHRRIGGHVLDLEHVHDPRSRRLSNNLLPDRRIIRKYVLDFG